MLLTLRFFCTSTLIILSTVYTRPGHSTGLGKINSAPVIIGKINGLEVRAQGEELALRRTNDNTKPSKGLLCDYDLPCAMQKNHTDGIILTPEGLWIFHTPGFAPPEAPLPTEVSPLLPQSEVVNSITSLPLETPRYPVWNTGIPVIDQTPAILRLNHQTMSSIAEIISITGTAYSGSGETSLPLLPLSSLSSLSPFLSTIIPSPTSEAVVLTSISESYSISTSSFASSPRQAPTPTPMANHLREDGLLLIENDVDALLITPDKSSQYSGTHGTATSYTFTIREVPHTTENSAGSAEKTGTTNSAQTTTDTQPEKKSRTVSESPSNSLTGAQKKKAAATDQNSPEDLLSQEPEAESSIPRNISQKTLPEFSEEDVENIQIGFEVLIEDSAIQFADSAKRLRELLKDERSRNALFKVLPDKFLKMLADGSLDTVEIPDRIMEKFLQYAVSLVDNESHQARSSLKALTHHFDLMLSVFASNEFVVIPPGELLKKPGERSLLFQSLVDLCQVVWQRDRGGDYEVNWLGEDPVLNPDIVDTVAYSKGFRYTAVTLQKKSKKASPPDSVRLVHIPAWRNEYGAKCPNEKKITLFNKQALDQQRGAAISEVKRLSAGFYSIGDNTLHISSVSQNPLRYALHIGSGIVFHFNTAEQLYDYWLNNRFQAVYLRPLSFKPHYIKPLRIRTASDCPLNDKEKQALSMFDLSLSDLMNPETDINKIYRQKALSYHGDKTGGDDSLFQDLQNAKECLIALREVLRQ